MFPSPLWQSIFSHYVSKSDVNKVICSQIKPLTRINQPRSFYCLSDAAMNKKWEGTMRAGLNWSLATSISTWIVAVNFGARTERGGKRERFKTASHWGQRAHMSTCAGRQNLKNFCKIFPEKRQEIQKGERGGKMQWREGWKLWSAKMLLQPANVMMMMMTTLLLPCENICVFVQGRRARGSNGRAAAVVARGVWGSNLTFHLYSLTYWNAGNAQKGPPKVSDERAPG